MDWDCDGLRDGGIAGAGAFNGRGGRARGDGDIRYEEAIEAVSENWLREVDRGWGFARTDGLVVVGVSGRSVYMCEPGDGLLARRAWMAAISSSLKPAPMRDVDHDGGRPTYL